MQTKIAKRLLALVLAVLMVCSLLPTAVFAEETTPDYELRVLTFEDADYKGGTNFAGGTDWSSLIDEPQFGGTLLYGEGGGVSSIEEAYKWTDTNNTWLSNVLSHGYGAWCYSSGGHAVSNYVSGDISDYGGFTAQLTVYKKGVSGLERTGGGHNGSNNFAVHFGYADNSGYSLGEDALPTLTFADGNMYVIDHMYVNNICYALNCYIEGNGLTAKIGPDDWVKLIATGYNTNGTKTGEASFYLCNGPDNIVTDWTKWDLTSLGKVAKVTFNVTGSSDNGYGFSQPAYFAYDDVAVQVGDGWPEPETSPVTVKVDGKEQYLEKLTGGNNTFAEEYYALSVPYGTSLTISMPKAPMILVKEIHEDELFNGDEGENSFVATENVLKSCLIDDGNLEAIGVKGFKPKAGNKAAFLSIMDSTVCKPYGLLIELECVPAAFVKLDKTELFLVEGDNATLTATVLPDNTTDKTLTWTTSDPEIATVENGAVTAVKAGKATITATCGSVKNTCAVTVRADLPEPKKDEDGTYLIDSVDALRWFSDNVNAGQSALNAKLTADIDLTGYDWTPIGESSSKYFAGNFDGQGHTITLKVEHTAATSGALNRGIFGTVKGTSSARPAIKNLTVTGEMNLSAGAYISTANAAAIVGSATYADLTNLHADVDITLVKKNGNCSAIAGVVGNISSTTVTNCSNSGNISGCDSVGGVVGKASGTGTAITGCYNTGNISASSNYAGGILSQLTSVVTIANCYNAGKVETTGMYAGGIVSYVSNASATVSNCFGFGEVNPPLNEKYGHGSVIGSLTNAGTVLTNLYYLEGSCTSGVGLNKSETQTATAKTAAEFVSADFVTAMNAGLTEAAYKANTGCGNYPILTWQSTPEHNYVDGVCTVCGELKAPELVEGVYQIGTADELRWFANAVNGGQYDLNAKLTADIDLENKPWTPIGNNPWTDLLPNHPGEYTGTFDGGGHVVKNLYINIDNADDNTGNKQGLFGYVTGKAVIKNLGVTGSVTTTGKRAGGIAGYLWGSPAKIENCFSAVDVTAHSYAGGIAGGGQSTSTVKITNCYNTGDITVTLGFAGGIAACGTVWASNGPYVSNCYNTGKITKVGGASGSDRLGAILCVSSRNKPAAYGSSLFYLEGCVEGVASVGADKTTAKTAEEMKSIAAELGDAFKTNTGCGSYPLLAWQAIVDHNYVDGKCTVCGEKDPAAPYLLDGVTDAAAEVQTGKSYQLDDLMDGKIFGVKNGTLTYKNYFYTMSSDGGATWSGEQHFEEAMFGGVNKSLIQSVAGTYIYKFRAKNDAGYSADAWTLTLTFSDVVEENVNFYISRDQNYDTNGNKYPILKLYKTAGIDEKQFDYVGWFTNGDGKTVYVYNPADYTIIDGETDYVEIDGVQYELHDYEKIEFTNSAFNAADETATASNTVVEKYNMFYATLSTGRYSTRGYGWNAETKAYDIYLGGQSLPLPMEKDIYGGGGNDIYLGVVSVYADTKNEKNEYFGTDDYHVEMIMPVTGSMIHSGTHYTYTRYGDDYTAFPFLSWEAQNASLYNIYAYPTNTEKYMFNQLINQTTAPSYDVVTKNIKIANAVELDITVPTSAEFTLFFQYNNFNTKAVEPYKDAVKNEETGMSTYFYRVSKNNSNYTWRLTDPTNTYVTKAGWLASLSDKTEKTITFAENAPTDKKSHDFSKLGTTVSSRDEADLQVFLSHSGFMSVSDTYRVRAFRMWQLINSDTANIMAEPKFNVQVLQGNVADIKQVNGGNAEGNWIDVKPTDTDIVAVTYDAIDLYNDKDVAGTHGGLFPATAPERTGVFVITNEAAGTADATVVFNGGTTSPRGAEWDYNYDTWYYLDTDEAPTLDFTVKAAEGVQVSYAVVTTNAALNSTLSDWTALTADENGMFHASLLPFRTAKTLGGTVILKLTDSTGTSYRLARVAQMSVTVKNASNSGEPIMPGDKVTLSFDGLYRGVDKVSGIFNPTSLYLNYSTEEDESMGSLAQYQQMDRASVTVEMPTDITFPEGSDKTTVMVTDGYISGGLYSAPSPFDTLYNMTDTGVGTNFSAVTTSFVASRLADVPVEVNTKVTYNVKLVPVDENGNAIDVLTPTLTDRDNKAVTAEADGTFKLGYGPYSYAVEQLGYVRTTGSFKLGSADAAKVENGVLTIKFTVRKAAENAWDGKTTTEPATNENGVYLIGTGAELAWFAQKVNGGSTKISGILTADIDLAGYEWTPIGTISKNFAGTFDGKNHTVDNLSINYSSKTLLPLYRGLFGWVSGANATNRAKIENLTVNGTVVAGSNKNISDAYVAGIVGRADYADLTNLHSNVDVSINRTGGNYQSVGGVVGGICYGTNVTNCSNSGNVTGWRYCAGIVGNIMYGSQPSTITGCVNTGNILAPSTCAAGIVSNLPSDCKVTACYNTGAIKAGGNYPAGIVGCANKSEVTNCFNLGTVTCNETFTYGSVIGTVSDANAVVKNLYYLDGSCVKGGIGSVKDKATQTATAKTAEEIANAAFVATMNTDLAEAAFMTGCTGTNHPILLWQLNTEHSFTQELASDKQAKEATCLEPAYYYVKCDNCGTVNTDLTVAVGKALGHDLKETVVEATCGKDGYTEHACTRCDYNYRDNFVEAPEHNYTVKVTKEASCTESGLKTYTCSKCGDTYTETVEKLAHNYEAVVTAPTCTAAGYTTHTCSVCKHSYVDTIVAATGHSYTSEITKAATCTETGVETFTCSKCGDTYTKAIEKTAHNYEAVVTAPTCTAMGYTTHTCSVCGDSYIDSIVKAKGHEYESKIVAPTCDKMGYTEFTCKNCGESYRAAYIPAKEHSYKAEVTTAPTCTTEGVKTFTCVDCQKSYTEPVAKLAHDYKTEVTAPTCTKMGYTTHTCSVCGDSYITDYTEAKGHAYSAAVTKEATCTAEGETTYTCAVCGDTYTEALAKVDHEMTTVVTPATCLGYGYTTNSCKHCDYSYISAITNPTGHTEAVDAAVEATCTETGLTEGKHCSVCNEVLVKQETVPAKGHTFENGVCTVCGAADPDYVPEWVNPFKDVKENDCFYDGVKFASQNGLFNGTSADTFSPEDAMTRAMLVTVLWRLDGKTEATKASSFVDVAANEYYAEAVAWAAENGIVNGVDSKHFAPEEEVTREQIAAILFRYAAKKGVDTTKRAELNAFPDANKVSSYAKDAMAWANAEGLIRGSKEGAQTFLAPTGTATRAQVALILMRYAEK